MKNVNTAVFVFVLLGCSFFLTASVMAAAPQRLFQILQTPAAVVEAERSSIASVKEARIAITSRSLKEKDAKNIEFSLFDGQTYLAKRLVSEGIEIRAEDNFTWRGKINNGSFSGDVVITSYKGFVSGLIYSPDAVYEIVPKGSEHFLVQLDQSLFPPCAGSIEGEKVSDAAKPTSSGAGVDSGDRVDVLVVYTAAVRNSAGGDLQAQTIAQQAIDATNTAYINSKIRQRVRLVAAKLTDLVETGSFSSELSNLRGDAATAALRNENNADLVDMLTNSTAACGIGYLMGSQGGNSNNGYTVTARTCAVGNLSFAHELGHNMGSTHNPENGSGATFPYGYGHYVNGNYRTVMSYVDQCPSGCSRVAYFSNPGVIFNNAPTGLENTRDNKRSLDQTADAIANYRYSGSSITLGNFNGGGIEPRSILRSLIWTSDNVDGDVKIEISRDAGTTWKTLFERTPNDNQEYFSLGTKVTKRLRLRISSISAPEVSDSSVSNFAIR